MSIDVLNKSTHAYVGRKPGCGCLVAMAVDMSHGTKQDAKWTSRSVAEMISDGLEVTRTTIEESRNILARCPHGKQQQQGSLLR